MAMTERWSRFWFAEVPPYSYALLRILFGLLGLVTLLGVHDIGTHWALDGLVPPAEHGSLPGLARALGLEAVAPTLIYLGCLAAMAAMTLGYRTGASVTAALIARLVHVSWNNLPLSGADTLLTVLIFFLVWADCGSVWSVDAWLDRRSHRDVVIADCPIAPLRLIRFQVALVYLSSGLWKLYSPVWRDGSALHYILNDNVTRRFPIPLPLGLEPMLTAASYLTLLWELSFAVLILFKPTRRVALVVGVLIHLGIYATLEIGPFSFVMLAAYAAFLDPHDVARLAAKRGFAARADSSSSPRPQPAG